MIEALLYLEYFTGFFTVTQEQKAVNLQRSMCNMLLRKKERKKEKRKIQRLKQTNKQTKTDV
jgi:hypothetical protein